MNSIPRVKVEANDGGWLASCGCGWSTWRPFRPGADLAARDHPPTHQTRRGA